MNREENIMAPRSSRWLWRTVGLISLAATVVLAFGFGYAVNDLLNPAKHRAGSSLPPEPRQPKLPGAAAEGYLITALGDSLTKGAGDETGQGYVKLAMELLRQQTDRPVRLVNNLAVNGMRADQLAERLKTDRGYRLAVSQANVVLLTIGGNDLFGFAQTGERAGGASSIDPEQAGALMGEGLERLDAVLGEIAAINPEAMLVYVGLYNPFYDVPELRDGSLQVQRWNDAAHARLHKLPNAVLVPTEDLFRESILRYLASDHYHPNQEGYRRIAERVVQALT